MKNKNDQQQKENATENKGIFATIREFFTDIAAYFSNIASKIANFFSSGEKQADDADKKEVKEEDVSKATAQNNTQAPAAGEDASKTSKKESLSEKMIKILNNNEPEVENADKKEVKEENASKATAPNGMQVKVESDEISISEEEEVVVVEVAPTQEGMQTAEQQGTPVAVDTTQIGSNSTTPNVQDPNANKEASK